MSDLRPPETAALSLEQCLFGYSDGHRLLAASVSLNASEEATLLTHSDLVSSHIDDDGYWTGLSLPESKYYALLRTWPAPEMPRPGCVWTHAILISFSDMARIRDLSEIIAFVRRPISASEAQHYAMPIEFMRSARSDMGSEPAWDDGAVVTLLTGVYGSTAPAGLAGTSSEWAPYIFRLWSQQWPRLRRSFTFQTASSHFGRSGGDSRFDLSVVRDHEIWQEDRRSGRQSDVGSLQATIIADFTEPLGSAFRQFIWRYGADIQRGRSKFFALAEIYQLIVQGFTEAGSYSRALGAVFAAFPKGAEAKLLKSDFVSFGTNQFSLIPVGDPLEALSFYINGAATQSLPELAEAAFNNLGAGWNERVPQLLEAAEHALERDAPVASNLLMAVAAVVRRDNFVSDTTGRPLLRKQLVANQPGLLDTDDIGSIPHDELIELLEFLPDDDGTLAAAIVGHLAHIDDRELAGLLTGRFVRAVVDAVFGALVKQIGGDAPTVAKSWIDAIHSAIENPSPVRLIEQSTSTVQLAACAAISRFDPMVAARVPTKQWALALKAGQDNLTGPYRQTLQCFLLALAISSPSKGTEIIFEYAFDPVHSDLARLSVRYDDRAILEPVLPNLPWYSQWDMCRRLRMAVANIYTSCKLDISSFLMLSDKRGVMYDLMHAVRDAPGGTKYLQKIT